MRFIHLKKKKVNHGLHQSLHLKFILYLIAIEESCGKSERKLWKVQICVSCGKNQRKLWKIRKKVVENQKGSCGKQKGSCGKIFGNQK